MNGVGEGITWDTARASGAAGAYPVGMTRADFSGYRRLVAGMAGPALEALASGVVMGPDSARWGVAPARVLAGAGEADWPAVAEGLRVLARRGRASAGVAQRGTWSDDTGLRDNAGHARAIYHLLVLHLHLAAFGVGYETMPVSAWAACEDAMPDALAPARRVEAWADAPAPPHSTDLALWSALCLLEQSRLLSRDVDAEVADSVVHRIVERRGPENALHPRGEEDSLDAWTYRELCGLHALASLALLRRNRAWAARVEEIALHHHDNTQPDNTTTEPWAIGAFLWSPKTRGFAEQQLHDTTAQSGGGRLGAIPAMLLADAAWFLRELGA